MEKIVLNKLDVNVILTALYISKEKSPITDIPNILSLLEKLISKADEDDDWLYLAEDLEFELRKKVSKK